MKDLYEPVSNLQKFPVHPDLEIRENRIWSTFGHVVSQVKGLYEPVSNLHKFPVHPDPEIQKKRKTGFGPLFGMYSMPSISAKGEIYRL